MRTYLIGWCITYKSTTAAINQYFNSTITKKVSNTYSRAVKPNVTSAVPIPKKPVKLNPNNSTAEKNSAPKVRDTTIKLQGGTYSTIKMKNSTATTTTTTTVPIKAGATTAKKEKRRFRHRVWKVFWSLRRKYLWYNFGLINLFVVVFYVYNTNTRGIGSLLWLVGEQFPLRCVNFVNFSHQRWICY